MTEKRPHPSSILAALLLATALVGVASCRRSSEVAAPDEAVQVSKAPPLRVIVVDDPAIGEAIEREWSARSPGSIRLEQVTSAALVGRASDRLGADVIIYPSALIGELAARQWLAPIRSDELEDPQLARRDLFSLMRLREVAWGEQVVAVPFGSPQLTICYRRDLFEQRGLTPPQSWEEYLSVARQLEQPPRAASQPASWHPVAEPLTDGWAGVVLLSRAASYARHRSQFSTLFDARSMEPLIAGPPFVRALNELVEAAKLGPADATLLDPAALWAGLADGRYGMILGWPSRGRTAEFDGGITRSLAAGFAELPGADEVYNFRAGNWERRNEEYERQVTLLAAAGRLGSQTRECRRARAALNLLFWLSGTELGREISPASPHTTLYRESQMDTVSRWIDSALDAEAGHQYAAAVQTAQSRANWLGALRLPGRDLYLSALDVAVQRAVQGITSSEEALAEASQRWRTVTAEIGVEQQRTAYLRSIGLEP